MVDVLEDGSAIEVRPEDVGVPQGAMRRRRKRIISYEQLLAMVMPEWLIEEILYERSLALLTGAPASLKTFLALNWALSVATGLPFHHRGVIEGQVVYLAAEGAPGLRRRIKAWLSGAPAGTEELLKTSFKALPCAVQMLDDEDFGDLLEDLKALEPAPIFVVIDTLARCMAGRDENSAQDMGLLIDRCNQIQTEIRTAVLLVHHGRKSDGDPRGSSALTGAVDTHVSVEKDDARKRVKVRCEKQKDGATFEPFELTWEPVEVERDQHDRPVTSLLLTVPAESAPFQCELTPKEREFAEAIWKAGGSEGVASTQLNQFSDSTRSRCTTALVGKGYIERRPLGKTHELVPTELLKNLTLPTLPDLSTPLPGKQAPVVSSFQPPTTPKGRGDGKETRPESLPGMDNAHGGGVHE